MTGQRAVLIAAFAGRALAQSAWRAGFLPLVVDCFGDQDTRLTAAHYRQIPGAVRHGFEAKPLFAALDELAALAPEKPIGIVLGSGFEDRPKLVASLDARYRLLGCNAEIVQQCKDPEQLFPLLKQLRIAHPEISLTRPSEPAGWLSKRIGGTGGGHVRDCTPDMKHDTRRYYQRRITGTPHSIFAVSAKGGIAMELSRQWAAPARGRPYRYGGAVMLDYQDSEAEQRMVATAATLLELIDPVGLVSFDFLVDGDTPYLLEINPRPGATLDIFDDKQGNLFRAQVEAGLGHELWQQRDLPTAQSRAAAILYADRGALTAGDIAWPEWSADRPMPGTEIAAGDPIATVFANGDNADAAQALARERLSTLSHLVYTSSESN